MIRRQMVVVLTVSLLFLSGCMYPRDYGSSAPPDEQIMFVQNAVDRFQEQTGVFPIKNSEEDTSVYEKYTIDFRRLLNGFLSEVPSNAYEAGGHYQYVLVDPDEAPKVKLIDLRHAEEMRSLRLQLNSYMQRSNYLPVARVKENGLLEIDYEKMGLDEPPYVESPYSQTTLPIVFDASGNLYVDYAPDIFMALEEGAEEPAGDLREVLVTDHPIVPAFSVPYAMEDETIVAQKE
ncbi:hypothetical protein G4V62_01485 [Bacillaceae bacterium SIJ1]|uniref:hypothetical protein n=1 Tax=Litoribacterium kuwaitense TaxID=1398745 RepID=UPI0013EA3E8F|nr:hypothetical protein [Litoribacterium kuwaitense]NGP43699.1 hypothetical protein [Litoribacterium kuwaitense]